MVEFSNVMDNKITFYEKLVYVAYGFYLLLGLVWFIMSMINSHFFNVQAFILIVAFAAQIYYKHRLTNLILGVLGLFLSIWMLMSLINTPDSVVNGLNTYDSFTKGLMWFSVLSIIMAGILMFSYTKLSFKDR